MNMNGWMYNSVWKIFGIGVFLYVLIGGMITPLNPGITAIVPDKAKAGETVKIITIGYNTHYLEANQNSAWIKLDSNHIIEAIDIEVSDDNTLVATFNIPKELDGNPTGRFATIITYNEIDGAAIRPSKLFVEGLILGTDAEWKSDFGMSLSKPQGIRFPFRSILDETIRNTFFHVALWLAMVCLLIGGLYHAILYLRNRNMRHDWMSSALNKVAIFYGILGLLTGSVWARFTWQTWWTQDIKLNMSAIAMLIYAAYLILRSSTEDFEKRARLSSVYSIFSFAMLIPLIFVIPRLTDSLHPGNGGNPALGGEDLDNTLRMFFYPSIIALILIGIWIASLLYRTDRLNDSVMSRQN